MLLKECPEIEGLTLRVHGESGIPEGSYDFWKTLFEAIKGCGRTVEIDMHAKGVDQKMIDIANATGMPVKLGAKYSAEHQSLGYQQADIRALEIPKPNSRERRAVQPELGFAIVHAVRVCGFSESRKQIQVAVSTVAGHAAAFAERRSGDGGGVRKDCAFLRSGWTGFDGAADVQGKGRLGTRGRAMRVCGREPEPEVRLGEIRTLLPSVGSTALRSGCKSGGVAQMVAQGIWGRGDRRGDSRGECEPDSAAADFGAFAIGVESLVLAGDVYEHAGGSRQRVRAVQRYAGAEMLWDGEPARSAFCSRRSTNTPRTRWVAQRIQNIRRSRWRSGWRIRRRRRARHWTRRGA